LATAWRLLHVQIEKRVVRVRVGRFSRSCPFRFFFAAVAGIVFKDLID